MKKKVFLIIGIILLILICSFCYIYSKDHYHFKIDYEIYNHIAFNNGKTIVTKVPSSNKIKYVEEKNLEEVLTSKTSVVYFGYPTCPWCRNIVPILLETVQQSSVETLYYVDVHAINTTKVLKILEPYLTKDENQKERLYVPDVYFIKDGKILTHHLGAVESYKNAFIGMSEEQKEELKTIYQDGINLILGDETNEK